MKKLLNLICLFSFCIEGCYTSGQVASRDNYSYNGGEVSYQTFYDQLQPYGNWIDYPGYGYVWQPNAGMDFRPYATNGHWVSTIDGWAWASDYNWGWAPFHYGRWLYEPAIGWAWVPGYEWAPAWVTWGQYDEYYAWAPLAPGISISMGNTWRAPYNYWSFIPHNYIQYSNPSRYISRNNFNRNVVNNITIINNYNSYNNKEYYHRGPDYREVERYTHKTITPVAITATQRPGVARINQRQFEVYRPAVSPNAVINNRNPLPARVKTVSEIQANADIRRRGDVNVNNRGATYNSGVNQNNTNTGSGNGSFNNNIQDRFNNPNNTTGNTDQGIGNPAAIDRNERIERLRQNNRQINTGRQPIPDQQLPQNAGKAGLEASPVIRSQQVPQTNPENNSDRTVIRPQQFPRNDQQFHNQRQEMRSQQLPSNNQDQSNNEIQNQRNFRNNNNIQRSQNIPEPNNNVRREQQHFPSSAPGVMPGRPSPPVRNVQPIPGGQQNIPAQRGGFQKKQVF